MILSTAMMLDWLGERQGSENARLAAAAIERSVDLAFGTAKVRSYDLGGRDGTVAIGRVVADAIRSGEADPA
jgi:3-isopropylmalate dehydrogenase